MLIKENAINSSTNILDNLVYIQESYSPAVIPVTENSRLGKYVISLEDINSYCEDNGSDPGYTISQICEMNNISTDNIAFSVSPESIILGEDVADNAIFLMNEGAEVLAKPVMHDSLYKLLKEDCERIEHGEDSIFLQEITKGFVDKMLGVDYKYGSGKRENPNQTATRADLYNRIARSKFANKEYHVGDIDPISGKRLKKEDIGYLTTFSHAADNRKKRLDKKQADEDRAWNIHDYGDEFATANEKHPERAGKNFEKLKDLQSTHYFIDQKMRDKKEQEQADKEAMKTAKEEVKTGMDEIHKMEEEAYKSDNKNFISKVIARLHDLSNSYSEKYKNVKVSGPKTAIQKVLSYITRAISSLTKRLHNMSTKYKIK